MIYSTMLYIWGADRVLAQIDCLSGNSYYYLYNGHGDVVQIVDTSGDIKNAYDYDVWGSFLKKEETIENHFTYFCQTYDETTGMYYLRARYYDPTTGRFTQQDPAEDGYNWYVYGNQNPVVYGDYTGETAYGTGVSASAAFGIKLNVQIMFVWDDAGHKGIIICGGVGAGTPNASLSGTVVINSANTIYDLEGMAISAGGSFGFVGGDMDASVGGSVSGGVSVLPAELHADINFGKIIWSW